MPKVCNGLCYLSALAQGPVKADARFLADLKEELQQPRPPPSSDKPTKTLVTLVAMRKGRVKFSGDVLVYTGKPDEQRQIDVITEVVMNTRHLKPELRQLFLEAIREKYPSDLLLNHRPFNKELGVHWITFILQLD